MRALGLLGLSLALALAFGGGALGHGGEDDVEELAKQPAKVLVQQAHALLANGQDPEDAAVRLDAAELSKDKKGIDPALVEQAHESLEQGAVDRAIALLERALAAPALEQPAEEAEPAPAEEEPAPAPEEQPAPPPEEEHADDEAAPAATAEAEEHAAETEADEHAEEGADEHEDEALLESEEARESIHGAAETFRPDRGTQELAAGIAGGVLVAAALGGLVWRRRRDSGLEH